MKLSASCSSSSWSELPGGLSSRSHPMLSFPSATGQRLALLSHTPAHAGTPYPLPQPHGHLPTTFLCSHVRTAPLLLPSSPSSQRNMEQVLAAVYREIAPWPGDMGSTSRVVAGSSGVLWSHRWDSEQSAPSATPLVDPRLSPKLLWPLSHASTDILSLEEPGTARREVDVERLCLHRPYQGRHNEHSAPQELLHPNPTLRTSGR